MITSLIENELKKYEKDISNIKENKIIENEKLPNVVDSITNNEEKNDN